MKRVISLILCTILISALFVGCKKIQKDSMQETAAQSETQQDVDEHKRVLQKASKIKEACILKREFTNLPLDESDSFSVQDVNGQSYTYYAVVKYKSIDEYRKVILSYYSEKAAKTYFTAVFDEKSELSYFEFPYLVERDAKLYCNKMLDGGGGYDYHADTVKLEELNGDKAVISVDCTNLDDKIITIKKSMVKENGLWVFDEIID